MDYKKIMLTSLKDDPIRIKHTYGVVERALELGKRYGADLNVLETSAYLHDITKMLSNKEHQELIDDKHLFDSLEPFMYHAYSAAALIEKSYSISDENILECVKYHLWGKIEMTKETMILCVSDFCEKNRTHKSAVVVYQLALNDLLGSYLKAIEETMSHVLNKGFKPHPSQIKVYNYYKEKHQKNGIATKNI